MTDLLVLGARAETAQAVINALPIHGNRYLYTQHPKSHDERITNLTEEPAPYPHTENGLALVMAGLSSIRKCAMDPEGTELVNVAGALRHCARLHSLGWRLIYFSSSAVFDGSEEWPNEDSLPRPATVYGRQKAKVEEKLLSKYGGDVEIWRMTKLALPGALPWRGWINSSILEAYTDVMVAPLAPISLQWQIRNRPRAEIQHFSPRFEASYFDVAKSLRGASSAKVDDLTPTRGSNLVPWRSTHPGLGSTHEMLRDTADQSLEEFAWSLMASEHQLSNEDGLSSVRQS